MIEFNIGTTVLSTSGCILNFRRTTIGEIGDNLGAYHSIPNASIVYGSAVHKFIDTMYKSGGYFPAAREAAEKAFERRKLPPKETQQWMADSKHLVSTCYNLWQQIESESTFDVITIPVKKPDGTVSDGPATEITFRILFYEDNHIRVWLCGTIDTIGKFKNGCFAIRDWKTTASYKKDEYMAKFRLSRQLRVYTLACKLEAQNNPDSILGRIGATKMGAFIDAIFLKSNSNNNEYARGEVYQYSEDDIAAFKLQLTNFCIILSGHVSLNYWPKQGILNESCSGMYGLCRFYNVCAVNDNVGKVLLNRDFTRRPYDPFHNDDQ